MRIYTPSIVAVVAIMSCSTSHTGVSGSSTTDVAISDSAPAADTHDTVIAKRKLTASKIQRSEDRGGVGTELELLIKNLVNFLHKLDPLTLKGARFTKVQKAPVAKSEQSRIGEIFPPKIWDGVYTALSFDPKLTNHLRKAVEADMARHKTLGYASVEKFRNDFGAFYIVEVAAELRSKDTSGVVYGQQMLEHLQQLLLKTSSSVRSVLAELGYTWYHLNYDGLMVLEYFIKHAKKGQGSYDTLVTTLSKYYGDRRLSKLLTTTINDAQSTSEHIALARDLWIDLMRDWIKREMPEDTVAEILEFSKGFKHLNNDINTKAWSDYKTLLHKSEEPKELLNKQQQIAESPDGEVSERGLVRREV